jgi:hypothetical protein
LLLLLLFVAGFFLILFKNDLFQTLNSKNGKPDEMGQNLEISSGTMVSSDAGGGVESAPEQAPESVIEPPKPELASTRPQAPPVQSVQPVRPAQTGQSAQTGQAAQEGPTLLPAPGNMLPANGYRIWIEELKVSRDIVFSWSAVPGANAYIFTLYQETPDGRRQIMQNAPDNRTSWTLANIGMLDQGTFFWQVEPVNMDRGGTITQRGRVGENSFVLDVPALGPVWLEETRIFYGN